MKKNYSGVMAMKEFILQGNSISNLEALLLFGVQNLQNEMRLMKRDGYYIKSQKVPMAKILRRLNPILYVVKRSLWCFRGDQNWKIQ